MLNLVPTLILVLFPIFKTPGRKRMAIEKTKNKTPKSLLGIDRRIA